MASSSASTAFPVHARAESVSSHRIPTSQRLAGSPRKAGAGGGGASDVPGGGKENDRRGLSTAPSSSKPFLPPRLALRVLLAALALFLLLHFVSPVLFGDSLAARAQERKEKMQGAGESWILPRKWREAHVEAGEGEVTAGGETLPECRRIMLFKFSNTHGFSSEILHYLRAGVIAQKLGYQLLADDSEWNYGSLSGYFLPRLVYCRPPRDWYDASKAVRVGSKRWQGKDRVFVSREFEDETDEWIRDEMLDPHAVEELRQRASVGHILPEGESLPPAFEEVFADFASVLKEVWRPNDQLSVLVRKQRMELGLGGGGLRHRKNSPTWGGRGRGGSSTSSRSAEEEAEDQEEWEYDVNERADRGPVIGVHLVGEKRGVDLSVYGLEGTTKVGNFSAVFEGASDAVRRLSHSSIASPSYSRTRPTLFPSSSTATLVALTSNTTLFSLFSSLPSSLSSNILRTSQPSTAELLRFNKVLRLELTEELEMPSGEAGRILNEFDQKTWNALPRGLKVLLARYFVRDLTTLALYADAFVVSAASPTGRLALLLAGEEGTIGPRDFHGGSFGGRVRSVDGWWVPTSKVGALWG
ncbi:hypothetical protein JCM8547_001889 [Rhodosporidiobolus lusitaniae]